jgi:predicted amidohydrolase
MGNLLFKNAHVIDPSQKLDTVGDVLVVDGKIADFGLLIYMCICVIRVLNIKRI